ncbi:MAG TPA: hypothetical protein VHN79_10360 [Lacunisphaera sp.]|nr:hypothetical protein [Lacunisphaera sp.]
MIADYLELLTRRDTLLALGVCLVVVGVVLRGLARSARREQALRKQHQLENLALAEAPDRTERHLEQHLHRYAAGTIIAGVLMCVVAFFR